MTTPAAPELLAPAGDWDALRAAVANGADAVYFGLSAFNARHRAANFTPEELPEVIDFLHARNVRGFVTLNTLIFSDELPDVADYVRVIADRRGRRGHRAGPRAGPADRAGSPPALHVHASTQMTLTEPRGIELVREQLGIRRVILARELSVADVRKVAAGIERPAGGVRPRGPVRRLLRPVPDERGARRPQRQPRAVRPGLPAAVRDWSSTARCATSATGRTCSARRTWPRHDLVADLIDAGVVSFKIEGRLKSPHYVAATTQTYRDAIDAAVARRPVALTRRAEARPGADVLARASRRASSRGRTTSGSSAAGSRRAAGVRVGTGRREFAGAAFESAVTDGDPSILAPGDGVVFDVGRPEETGAGRPHLGGPPVPGFKFRVSC